MSRNETKEKAALERLVFMGLMKDECTVNAEVMPVFAGIFAGLFYWDVLNHFGDDKQAAQTMMVFQALPVKEYHNMYLFLSLMYDSIGKTLPDPVWWLSCSPKAVVGFMTNFAASMNEIVSAGGNNKSEKLEEKM